MPSEEIANVSELQGLLDDAKKIASTKSSPKDPANMTDVEENAVVKDMDALENNIENTRSTGENILSRLEKGVITKSEAKKQMKQLLNDCGVNLLANLMVYGSIGPDIKVTDGQIKDAMKKVNETLGR